MNIPEKPEPPECRIECSSCGYIASESEFKEKHKYCYFGFVKIIIIIMVIPLMLLAVIY